MENKQRMRDIIEVSMVHHIKVHPSESAPLEKMQIIQVHLIEGSMVASGR